MRLFASAVMTGGAVFFPVAGFKMVKARTKKKKGEKANNLFIDFSLMLDAIADSEPFGKKSILKFREFLQQGRCMRNDLRTGIPLVYTIKQ
jgi:hypothetical protein